MMDYLGKFLNTRWKWNKWALSKHQYLDSRGEDMIVLLYFDWFGSVEELKESEEKLRAAFAQADGVEYKGRYAPDNRKFHFVYVYEVESYEKLLEVLTDPEMPPRDYKKMTHGVFEVLRGPLT